MVWHLTWGRTIFFPHGVCLADTRQYTAGLTPFMDWFTRPAGNVISKGGYKCTRPARIRTDETDRRYRVDIALVKPVERNRVGIEMTDGSTSSSVTRPDSDRSYPPTGEMWGMFNSGTSAALVKMGDDDAVSPRYQTLPAGTAVSVCRPGTDAGDHGKGLNHLHPLVGNLTGGQSWPPPPDPGPARGSPRRPL
jgi:hypothetical protein